MIQRKPSSGKHQERCGGTSEEGFTKEVVGAPRSAKEHVK